MTLAVARHYRYSFLCACIARVKLIKRKGFSLLHRSDNLMAKRRGEETVLLDSPSKRRHFPPVYSVDMQLESMASVGGVSSPSLLTLLGGRCRKRPLYFDNEEAYSCPTISPPGSGKHAKDVFNTPCSGSVQGGRRSCALARNKRPRENSVGSDSVHATDKTADEDGTYNSFQYWRVPLPELDLSLLEESSDRYPKKDKSKENDTTADAMET